jgi:Ca2+:H+ antiporter
MLTFASNAVELIVSILALTQNQVLIVQTSLIGSMLSNLLLVMGMCFFFGGLNRVEQYFNVTVAQTASSLLALAIGSLIIPTAFYLWASASTTDKTTEVTSLSRGVAILLLIIYGSYLFFQLKTHTHMYNEPSKKVGKRRVKAKAGDALRGMVQGGANMSAAVGGDVQKDNIMQLDDDKEKPQLSVLVAILTLAISTALVAVCAEFMVDSINALTTGPHGISKTFVGLILLPIVGNAAEHATAVTVACKDKMDLAIGVAVGSSLQIALFVLPFIVVIGWCMGNDTMNLNFDGFQVAVLFVAVLLGKATQMSLRENMC